MLTEHNDQLFAEFTRVTGSTCRFAFVPWIADRQRDAMRLLRFTAFDAYKRNRQHAELMEHLESLPTRGQV